MIRLGIVFGGRSSEHEISCLSAASVTRALNKEKFTPVMIGITKSGAWMTYNGTLEDMENADWEKSAVPMNIEKIREIADFILPILHGTYGEDGTIQGLFEMLDVPYAGCGVLASSAAMDKIIAKDLFVKAGIPSCKYIGFESKHFTEAMIPEIEAAVGYPCFVKPANQGSSVGVTKAHDRAELEAAVSEATKFDRRIIVEEGIDARECEIGVIGNEDPLTAAVGEIIPGAEFYDYSAKYRDDAGTVLDIPASKLDSKTAEEIAEYAKKAYKALDCAGFARCDFFVEKGTGRVLLNEINTIPGFTKYSMFPLLWGAKGVPYDELIERIVDYGYERYNAKNNRQTSR